MKLLKGPKRSATFIWLLAACLIASGLTPLFAQSAWDQLQKAHTKGFSNIESGQGVPIPLPAGIISPVPSEVHPARTKLPAVAKESELPGFTQKERNMIYAIGRFVEKKYVDPVDRQKIFYGALKGMINELDSNSAFYTPEEWKKVQEARKGSYAGVGMALELKKKGKPLVVKFPFPGSPAKKAGIKAGDQILRINGEDIISSELNDTITEIKGAPGTYVEFMIRRDSGEEGKPASIFNVRVKRTKISLPNLRTEVLPGQIGYIQLESFRGDSAEKFAKELKKIASKGRAINGLIVDLRNNRGGVLDSVIKMCAMFLENEKVIVTGYRRDKEVMAAKTAGDGTYTGLPLVVLVNGLSASASEIFAGSMQDHRRATIIGSRTYGKGTVQSIIIFPDGSALKLTMQRYYLPSGRSIDGTMTGKKAGLEPDIRVDLSKEDEVKLAIQLYDKLMGIPLTKPVRDDALEKALEILGKPQAVSRVMGSGLAL